MAALVDRLSQLLFEKGVNEDPFVRFELAKAAIELVRESLPQCSECGVKFITASHPNGVSDGD